jgi:hypothetical protein
VRPSSYVAARTYTILVEGELGPRYDAAFPGMTVRAHDGVTEIAGRVKDQAQLRGILDTVAAYNLTLLSIIPTAEGIPEGTLS